MERQKNDFLQLSMVLPKALNINCFANKF